MSTRAKRFLYRFYKQRKQGRPLAMSVDAAAEAMEAFWQHQRERELLPTLIRQNKALDQMADLMKKIRKKTR